MAAPFVGERSTISAVPAGTDIGNVRVSAVCDGLALSDTTLTIALELVLDAGLMADRADRNGRVDGLHSD